MTDQSSDNTTQELLYLNSQAKNIHFSPTLEIDELVVKKKQTNSDILHMGFGESTMPLHPLLKSALAEAATYTRYGPVRGLSELRVAIAEYLNRTRGIACTSDQIVIGPGSKSLIYAILRLLEGDVLLPNPSWVSYAPIARLGGKKAILVQTDPTDHHTLNGHLLTQTLNSAIKNGANPKILLINSPDNPTGTMFDENTVQEIATWAKENGIALISDEIYAELAHGWCKHISPYLFYPQGCIVTGGMSKAFSAGGWRLGYIVLPKTETGEKVIDAIRAFGSTIWSTTATPIQKAAVVAYTSNDSIENYITNSASVFGHVTQKLYKTFQTVGVTCPKPAGGFYLYPDFSKWRTELAKRNVHTGVDLSHYLLEEWNIATLPASAFNEDPLTLRLRLSTSSLCDLGVYDNPAQREEKLWDILDNAYKKNFKSDFPILTKAQKRWSTVVKDFTK